MEILGDIDNMNGQYVLTLEDANKYLVISKVNYNGITYCYLGKLDDSSIFKYAKIINDDLQFVEDEKIINEITPLLLKNLPNS